MNSQLQRQILDAREAIIKVRIAPENGGQVPKVFKGYIAGLGPTIVSNGLLVAVLLYEDDAEKKKVSCALHYLLERKTTPLSEDFLNDSNRPRNYHTLKQIADYAIALKLALSTFTLVDDTAHEQAAV